MANILQESNNNNDADLIEVDDDDWTCYRLNLHNDMVIDIPRDMASVQNYSASLGHKVRDLFCGHGSEDLKAKRLRAS